MLAKNLQTEFKKRGPWVTRFVIDGRAYGGRFDALKDGRLSQFFRQFPEAHTILELGSLEGGHTIGLAKFPGVQRVLGLEGRQANLDRARFVQTLLGVPQVDFVLENLETVDLSRFGKFDAVFCVGVLYHLPRPWELIAQIAQVSPHLFIWTHYAADKKADKTIVEFRGMEYRESGLRDPLSGLSPSSFWPTLEALTEMLTKHGFTTIRLIENNPSHPHGPAVTVAAVAG